MYGDMGGQLTNCTVYMSSGMKKDITCVRVDVPDGIEGDYQ